MEGIRFYQTDYVARILHFKTLNKKGEEPENDREHKGKGWNQVKHGCAECRRAVLDTNKRENLGRTSAWKNGTKQGKLKYANLSHIILL